MRKRVLALSGFVALAMLVISGVSSAETLGSTTMPAGSAANDCFADGSGNDTFLQYGEDPSAPYYVSTSGTLAQWQTNTVGDTAGQELTFVVASPNPDGSYSVVGADTETLPSPLPAVASFTLSNPIAVKAGDTVGLYSPGDDSTCYFEGGSVPADDSITGVAGTSPPSSGETLEPDRGPMSPGFTIDVAATVDVSEDAGVSTSAGPANAATDYPALLSSTVTNNGPGTDPITFTDNVPAGLTVDSAVAGSGGCTTSGQTVTCTISGLGTGDSAPVNIVVTPNIAGTYNDAVSVSLPSGDTDPNPANNTATAKLFVSTTPTTTKCLVPRLRSTSKHAAKKVLHLLGCKVKVKRAHSRRVGRGGVVRTKPRAGAYPLGKVVTLIVSSGR